MKFQIELDLETVGEATCIQKNAEAVLKYERIVRTSRKTKRELLAMFNADFEEFRSFVFAAVSIAEVAIKIRECRLDE